MMLMRLTVTIDESLLRQARTLTGIRQRSALPCSASGSRL
jgi:hypothetical protein